MEAAHISTNQTSKWNFFKDLFFELKNSKEWPTSKTACALISTATNIACEILKSSFLATLRCNAPIRIFSILLHREDTSKVVLEVAAIVSLIALAIISTPATSAALVSFSRLIMITLDLAPELLQIIHHFPHKNTPPFQELPQVIPQEQPQVVPREQPLIIHPIIPQELPLIIHPIIPQENIPAPMTRVEAIQFLKLTEQEANDLAITKEHYIRIVKQVKTLLIQNPKYKSAFVHSFPEKILSQSQEAFRILGGIPHENDGNPYIDLD